MKISKPGIREDALTHHSLEQISSSSLRAIVEAFDYRRHYKANLAANQKARDTLYKGLSNLGYRVELQGEYDNVVATPPNWDGKSPLPLLGAHYDTVPTTPGADDNSSAIAVCMESARVLAGGESEPIIVIFNREEDGLLGSLDFVKNSPLCQKQLISEAHIFEMVGYYCSEPGSQAKPGGLPVPIPDTGDFIGLLSNSNSNKIASKVASISALATLQTPLVSLKAHLGIEKLFADLLRSDHAPFWEASIPALMWTDTSNFRNPHYHQPSDTPDTLDYEAMADVTAMIVAYLLQESGELAV